jgi:hypothetical protein
MVPPMEKVLLTAVTNTPAAVILDHLQKPIPGVF